MAKYFVLVTIQTYVLAVQKNSCVRLDHLCWQLDAFNQSKAAKLARIVLPIVE